MSWRGKRRWQFQRWPDSKETILHEASLYQIYIELVLFVPSVATAITFPNKPSTIHFVHTSLFIYLTIKTHPHTMCTRVSETQTITYNKLNALHKTHTTTYIYLPLKNI